MALYLLYLLYLFIFYFSFTSASYFNYKPNYEAPILVFPFDKNLTQLLATSEGEINLFEETYNMDFEIELKKENCNFLITSQNFSKVLIQNQISLGKNITLGILNIEFYFEFSEMTFLFLFEDSALSLINCTIKFLTKIIPDFLICYACSKTHFKNVSFLGYYEKISDFNVNHQNFLSFFEDKNEIQMEKVFFNNIKWSHENVFYFENSLSVSFSNLQVESCELKTFAAFNNGDELILNNLMISYNNLVSDNAILEIQNFESDYKKIIIKNLSIIDNKISSVPFQKNLIFVQHTNEQIIFDNLTIKNNIASYQNSFSFTFFFLYNLTQKISITNSSVLMNFDFDFFFYLDTLTDIEFTNVIFFHNKFVSETIAKTAGNLIFAKEIVNLTMTGIYLSDSYCLNIVCFLIVEYFSNQIIEESSIRITNSTFTDSLSFFINVGYLFPGCIFFFSTAQKILLISNKIIASQVAMHKNLNNRIGDSCIYSYSDQGRLNITEGFFAYNQAEVKSNCLFFWGVEIYVEQSAFYENFDYFSNSYLSKNDSDLNSDLKNAFYTFGGALNVGSDVVIFKDLVLKNNSAFSGGAVGLFLKFDFRLQTILMLNCIFKWNSAKNGGAVYFHNYDMLTFLHFNISSCEFDQNEAYKDGGVFYDTGILVNDAFFNFESCFFVNNKASRAGILFNAVLDLRTFFQNCLFDNNIALSDWEGGGVINNYDLHEINFEDCKFILNKAQNKGGVGIFEKGFILIVSCVFVDNSALRFGGYFVIQRDAGLEFTNNKVIRGETADHGGLFTLLNNAYCNVSNSDIEGFFAEKGSFISVIQETTLTISNVTLTRCRSTFGTVIYTLHNLLKIIIYNMTVSESISERKGNLFYVYYTDIHAEKLSLYNNQEKVFEFLASSSIFLNLVISNHSCNTAGSICFFSGLFNELSFLRLKIKNLNISSTTESFILDKSSIILFDEAIITDISLNNFIPIAFLEGEFTTLSLNLVYFDLVDMQCLISLVRGQLMIEQVYARGGGEDSDNYFLYSLECFFIQVVQLKLFYFKSKKYSALYIISSSSNNSVTQSTLIENHGESGGSIYFKNGNFTSSENLFYQNFGYEQGGSSYFSCQEGYLCLINITLNKFIKNKANFSGGAYRWDFCYIFDKNNTFLDNDAPHGKDFASQPRYILNLNETNYFVSGESIKNALYFTLLDYYNQTCSSFTQGQALIYFEKPNMKIIGDKVASIKNGSIKFLDLKFIATPGKQHNFFLFSSELIDFPLIKFTLSFRDCTPDEIFISSLNVCQRCPENYYSLKTSDTCKPCPLNAVCYGGNNISIVKGFWTNSTEDFERIYECNILKDSCQGGDINGELCSEGYEGPLCGVCKFNHTVGFYKTFDGKCFECSVKPSPLTIIFFIFTLFIILLQTVFSVKEDMKLNTSKNTDEKSASMLTNNLMSYFLIISLIYDFPIEWPNGFLDITELFGFLNSLQESIGYSDCVRSNLGFWLDINTSKVKILITIFLYVLIYAGIILFWIFLKLIKRITKIKNFVIVSFIALYKILLHPVIKFSFMPFHCLQIGSKSFLKMDMNIECWSFDHYDILIIIMIFNIVLFALPILVLFFILTKHRNRLNVPDIRQRYLLFYVGFKKKYYFWEFISIFKKILTIFILFYWNSQPMKGLILCIIILLFFNLIMISVKPYLDHDMNILEILQNCSYILTFFFSLIYINVASILKNVVAILIITINVVFILLWFKMFFRYFRIFIQMGVKKLDQFNFLQKKGKISKSSQQKLEINVGKSSRRIDNLKLKNKFGKIKNVVSERNNETYRE